jgi:hypothetical protein
MAERRNNMRVVVLLPKDEWLAGDRLAEQEDRTIEQQARHLIRQWLSSSRSSQLVTVGAAEGAAAE